MNYQDAIDLIKTRWLLNFPAIASAIWPAGVETRLENHRESEPQPPAVWCYFTLETDPEERLSLGSPARFRTRGRIWIRFHYPAAGVGGVADGTKTLGLLADAIRPLMSEVQFGEGPGEDGIITRTFSVLTTGNDGNLQDSTQEPWWMLAVVIPFEYTDHR